MPQSAPFLDIITIEAQFGSEFQRDVAMRALKQLLDTWKQTVEATHKQNKIIITKE